MLKRVRKILVLGGLLSSSFLKAQEFPTEMVTYKTGEDYELQMKIYYPQNWSSQSPKLPAAVFFFGGGWNSGEITAFDPQSQFLAKLGMICICPQYRIKNVHKTIPLNSLEDAKSAMRYIYKNADKLGIDKDKIIAGGGSAGGHLATGAYFCSEINDPNDDISIECKPKALILFNPVIDNGPEGYGYERVKDYWQKFSPLHNIEKNTLPVLFMVGDSDRLLPVATCEKFKEKLEENGGSCKLIVYPQAPHGFFHPVRNGVKNEFHEQTLKEIELFVRSLGYIAV